MDAYTYSSVPVNQAWDEDYNSDVFDDSKAIELIYAVKNQPVLWDKQHPDIRKKAKISSAWQTIASAMNLNEEDCKEKWRNLLCEYRENKRKDQIAKRKKNYVEELHQPSWFAYKHMTFLTETRGRIAAKTEQASYEYLLDPLDLPMDNNEPSSKQSLDTWENSFPSQSYDAGDYQQTYNKERQRVAPFIEMLTQRLLRKDGSQVEMIENALLNVLSNFPNAQN